MTRAQALTFVTVADASDPDGSIAKVDFFQGATLIGTATTAPYSATTASLGSGSYSFTAVATDSSGASATSTVVSVRVNAAPTVSISQPASGTSFGAPANITIAADAADIDGTIASVSFYQKEPAWGLAAASTPPIMPPHCAIRPTLTPRYA